MFVPQEHSLATMDLQDEIERLDGEVEVAEMELVQVTARLAGLRAQRDAYMNELAARADKQRPVAAHPLPQMPDLRALDRTDAIIEVLGRAGRTMSIQEVWDALKAAGRSEASYQAIASTLSFLERADRVLKPSRGRYAALAASSGRPKRR